MTMNTAGTTPPPAVIEGEVLPPIDLAPQPLQHPPAVREQHPPAVRERQTCLCGNGTAYGHGAIPDPRNPGDTLPPMSCQTILEIRASVATDLARRPSRLERLAARFGGA